MNLYIVFVSSDGVHLEPRVFEDADPEMAKYIQKHITKAYVHTNTIQSDSVEALRKYFAAAKVKPMPCDICGAEAGKECVPNCAEAEGFQ